MTTTNFVSVAALVIDDNALIAWDVESVLRDVGLRNIVVAGSSTSARVAAQRETFGLLVCDLNLGPFSSTGFELLAEIDPTEQIPTIIHTAYNSSEVAEALAKFRPAALVVHKPATSAQMNQAVRISLNLSDDRQNGTDPPSWQQGEPGSATAQKMG